MSKMTRILLTMAALAAILTSSTIIWSSTSSADPAPEVAAADAGSPTPDAAPAGVDLRGTPEPAAAAEPGLLEKLDTIRARYEDLRDREEGRSSLVLWSGLLAAVTFVLLDLVNRFRRLSDRGRAWLPYVALSLGAVAGVTGALHEGLGWADAVILGVGPTLAVVAAEIRSKAKRLLG